MEKSYNILKAAIENAGVKTVAAELNLSHSMIYKWCQQADEENSKQPSGAANPLDRIKRLYEVTQDPEIISWICQMADGYFVQNPPLDKENYDARVLKNIQKIITEFSEALEAITKSYNDDKRINEKEATRIRKEWEDLKRAGESFVKDCEAGKFDKLKKRKS